MTRNSSEIERLKRREQRRLRRLVAQTPKEVLQDIFHRLPFKLVSRLKVICKDWNSTISDPDFVIRDFRLRSKSNHIIVKLPRHQLFLFTVINLDISDDLTFPKDPRYFFDCSNATIIGSYNGLVALVRDDDNKYMLWNPLTRKHTSFTGDDDIIRKPDSYHFKPPVLYGLCYDDFSNGYSIVATSQYEKYNFGWSTVITNLSTGAKKWLSSHCAEVFQLFEKRLIDGGSGKVVCGYPHWLLSFQDMGNPVVQKELIYFDFKDEVYKQLERPRETFRKDMRVVGLATLGGQCELSMVLYSSQSSSLEVWVMKEYGNVESWSNVFVISTRSFKHIKEFKCVELFGDLQNGDVLIDVNSNDELFTYNVAKREVLRYRLFDDGIPISREYDDTPLTCYHPSIISPLELGLFIRHADGKSLVNEA